MIRNLALIGGIAAATAVADQLSKQAYRDEPADGRTLSTPGPFRIAHYENEGLALGGGAQYRPLTAGISLVAAPAIALGALAYSRGSIAAAIGGGLMLGGLSNSVEALTRGTVTDWIEPTFLPGDARFSMNVADAAATTGLLLCAAAVAPRFMQGAKSAINHFH